MAPYPSGKLQPRTLTQPCKDEELRSYSPRYLYPKHVITGSPSRGLPSSYLPLLYVTANSVFSRRCLFPLFLALAHSPAPLFIHLSRSFSFSAMPVFYFSLSPTHSMCSRVVFSTLSYGGARSSRSLFLSSGTGSGSLKYLADRNILRFRERASRPPLFGGPSRPQCHGPLLIRKNVHANLILPLTLTLRGCQSPLAPGPDPCSRSPVPVVYGFRDFGPR